MSSSTDSTTDSGTVPAQGGAGDMRDLATRIRDAYAAFARATWRRSVPA